MARCFAVVLAKKVFLLVIGIHEAFLSCGLLIWSVYGVWVCMGGTEDIWLEIAMNGDSMLWYKQQHQNQ